MSLKSNFAATADQIEKQVEAVYNNLEESTKGRPAEKLVSMSKDLSLNGLRQWREFNENALALIDEIVGKLVENTQGLLKSGSDVVETATAAGKAVAEELKDAVDEVVDELKDEAKDVKAAGELLAEEVGDAAKKVAAEVKEEAKDVAKAAKSAAKKTGDSAKKSASAAKASTTKAAKSISAMTKAELITFAESKGIDVKSSMTKAQIKDAIEA